MGLRCDRKTVWYGMLIESIGRTTLICLIYREEVHKEASLLLVGDWVACTVPSLVDEIVFGLLPHLLLQRKSQKMAIQLSLTVSKSVLGAQHTLLSGMKEFVKKKGTCL